MVSKLHAYELEKITMTHYALHTNLIWKYKINNDVY